MGHAKDRIDVAAMVGAGLVDPRHLLELYLRLTPGELSRYPRHRGRIAAGVDRAFDGNQ